MHTPTWFPSPMFVPSLPAEAIGPCQVSTAQHKHAYTPHSSTGVSLLLIILCVALVHHAVMVHKARSTQKPPVCNEFIHNRTHILPESHLSTCRLRGSRVSDPFLLACLTNASRQNCEKTASVRNNSEIYKVPLVGNLVWNLFQRSCSSWVRC